jgi:hypothetical protein
MPRELPLCRRTYNWPEEFEALGAVWVEGLDSDIEVGFFVLYTVRFFGAGQKNHECLMWFQ